MIKKIYDFLKKILNEYEEENVSNPLIQNFSSSKNSDELIIQTQKIDLLNESSKIQPCDEINPITGQISYGGVDLLGNPYGSDINSLHQNFGSSLNNDFHNN